MKYRHEIRHIEDTIQVNRNGGSVPFQDLLDICAMALTVAKEAPPTPPEPQPSESEETEDPDHRHRPSAAKAKAGSSHRPAKS